MASPLRRPDVAARRTLSISARPALAVVPGRRRVASFAVGLTALIGVVLVAVVLVHTSLAERQLELDRLERQVLIEREQFDVLRAQRAELRSPTRLAEAASALGMTTQVESTFVAVDPWVLAAAVARTGELPFDAADPTSAWARPLDQFRAVKTLEALDSDALDSDALAGGALETGAPSP